MSTDYRAVQVFPSGRIYRVLGEYPEFQVAENRSDEFRPATIDEAKAIQAQELAEAYANRDVLCCDSSLIGMLLASELDGFGCDDIENLYASPDDWSLEQCRDYLEDYGGEQPEPNPWTMYRGALVDELESVGYETDDNLQNMADDELRSAVAQSIDIGAIDGLDDWRDACRDTAQENPADVMEWWRVSDWLCRELRESGEVILDNDFGCWWGRTCTGQGYLMDGTLQAIAQRYLNR